LRPRRTRYLRSRLCEPLRQLSYFRVIGRALRERAQLPFGIIEPIFEEIRAGKPKPRVVVARSFLERLAKCAARLLVTTAPGERESELNLDIRVLGIEIGGPGELLNRLIEPALLARLGAFPVEAFHGRRLLRQGRGGPEERRCPRGLPVELSRHDSCSARSKRARGA